MSSKINAYSRLVRWDKPIGSYLLLWPTLSALWLASAGVPTLKLLVIFVLGVLVMRAFGCIVNDLADRRLDVSVERTKDRPLATGEISPWKAVVFALVLGLIAFGLVLLLNRLCLIIAIILIILTIIYPFLKRITHLPQLGLGIIFNGVLMAYAAVLDKLPPTAWLLLCASICLTIAYDTVYAIMDRPDDARVGILSTAILFANNELFFITGLQVLSLVFFSLVGWINHLNMWYWDGLFVAACTFVYQFVCIRQTDYLKAFKNYNIAWLCIFIGIVFSLAH